MEGQQERVKSGKKNGRGEQTIKKGKEKDTNCCAGQEQVLEKLFANQNAAAIFPTGYLLPSHPPSSLSFISISNLISLFPLPISAGKSLCFQVPSLVLPGVVVVITPLIAIMKDQVDYLQSINIKAEVYILSHHISSRPQLLLYTFSSPILLY